MKWAFVVFAFFYLVSCKQKPVPEGKSTGSPAEVLLIASADEDLFIANLYGYRDSLLIDANNIPKRTYESGFNFWKSSYYPGQDKQAHMILVPDLGEENEFREALTTLKPRFKNEEFSIYEDVWSKPQMVVSLNQGSNYEKAWINSSRAILDSFKNFEIATGLRGFHSANEQTANLGDLIEAIVGVRFQIPPQFQAQKSDSTIVWLNQSANTFYQHLLVSSIAKEQMPQTQMEAELQREDFINTHIKNDEGSRIIVSKSPYFKKAFEPIEIKGKEAKRLIGWYAEEGTFRRGIFHRYYIPKGDRIIIFDAFAFAPDKPKSRFNRLFEIIANTYRD